MRPPTDSPARRADQNHCRCTSGHRVEQAARRFLAQRLATSRPAGSCCAARTAAVSIVRSEKKGVTPTPAEAPFRPGTLAFRQCSFTPASADARGQPGLRGLRQ